MNFLRKLLWPFSLIYGSIAYIRNMCYTIGIFKRYPIPDKSICIGNLSTGGTGKSPHAAFLAEYYSPKIETSILSRGYGRATSGFILVNSGSKANEVGDEPLMYQSRFKDKVHVAVCEDRKKGIQELRKRFPSNKLIILDDAYQHLAVKAGKTILLTEYYHPYFKDLVLPAGNLREFKCRKKRADLLIVTKTPEDITAVQKSNFIKRSGFDSSKVYFSKIKYGKMISFGMQKNDFKNIILVTGIANSKPLCTHLIENYSVEEIKFRDHHIFSQNDIIQIHQKFDTFAGDETIILTTEKDFMRMKDYIEQWNLTDYPWYYLPITIEIDRELQFKEEIDQYVNTI